MRAGTTKKNRANADGARPLSDDQNMDWCHRVKFDTQTGLRNGCNMAARPSKQEDSVPDPSKQTIRVRTHYRKTMDNSIALLMINATFHLFDCATHRVDLENRWATCLQESMNSSARFLTSSALVDTSTAGGKQYPTVEQLCQKSQRKHFFTRHVRRLFHFSSSLLHDCHKSHSNQCTVLQP